tara:strand:- start:187 stop:540 length:354 start_codon:yes stop_codon:yes gene_type:complete
MRFKAKKQYGNYKMDSCPFCGKVATQKNEQGVAVCRLHLKETVEDRKCQCGKWLELRSGKFGPYFNCINCGNMNYDKGMVRSTAAPVVKAEVKKFESNRVSEKKVIEITSNDVEYFD